MWDLRSLNPQISSDFLKSERQMYADLLQSVPARAKPMKCRSYTCFTRSGCFKYTQICCKARPPAQNQRKACLASVLRDLAASDVRGSAAKRARTRKINETCVLHVFYALGLLQMYADLLPRADRAFSNTMSLICCTARKIPESTPSFKTILRWHNMGYSSHQRCIVFVDT